MDEKDGDRHWCLYTHLDTTRKDVDRPSLRPARHSHPHHPPCYTPRESSPDQEVVMDMEEDQDYIPDITPRMAQDRSRLFVIRTLL